MTERISAVVLVRNHRQYIGPCLRTLTWVDEVVLVDDGSTDGTLEIARRFPNVRIVHRALAEDWAAQMNWGMEQATGEWILQLDVDERVPSALAQELRQRVGASDVHGIGVRILGNFLGCLMGHQPSGPYAVRMVRRGKGRFQARRVHALPEVQGNVARAQNLLVHLGPFPTAESFWTKNVFYAHLEARSNLERHERLVSDSTWSYLKHFLLKPCGIFLQKYLWQGGWQMGVTGLHFALMRAVGYYMVYLATWEMQRGDRNDLRDYCISHGIPYLDESETIREGDR